MNQLFLATTNPGKLKELTHSLQTIPQLTLIPQTQLAITEVEETGLTFIENAILKARHACAISKLPTLAEDSGLVIDALDGRPGIYSARYAGKDASPLDKINKILAEMAHIPLAQRSARFYCAMVVFRFPDDPTPIISEGSWEGVILTHAQGAQGFGYDPIFGVPSYGCSAAELDITVKNQLSHRAQALQQLVPRLQAIMHNH